MHDTHRPHLWRSRWAAIGAAVAVTLGAGGLVTTFAASTPSDFVAISPVRVLDTRLPAMGPALASGVPRALDVTGLVATVGADGSTIGNATVVPDGATAIVANVTIVAPTTAGFVSVRPGSATGSPTTSSLNAATPGVIVPNAVTVELPTTGATAGQIQLWFQGTNPNATADLLVDVVGYYTPGASGPQGPAGMTYVGTFTSSSTTGIGPDFPPLAPNNYTATFNLAPGRYYVAGDLSVKNTDTIVSGNATCTLFVNEDALDVSSTSQVNPQGFANFAIARTFTLATGGPTTLSYRCLRTLSSSMQYWLLNMNVFQVS